MQMNANTLGEVNQGGSTRIGRPATKEREKKTTCKSAVELQLTIHLKHRGCIRDPCFWFHSIKIN